jgi:Ca-activated chloride channel family protein
MSFENAWFVFLLLPVAAAAAIVPVVARRRRSVDPALRFPALSLLSGVSGTVRSWTSQWLWVPRIVALILLVIAIAGPRKGIETVHDTTRGVDIALCIDVSGSMRQGDLARGMSRIDVAKRVASDFVDLREHDRIALVPFAKFAYRMCPLTLQHEWVKQQLARLRVKDEDPRRRIEEVDENGLIDPSQTAIGTALAVATNALKSSDAKSKVIILLTDGQSNFGKLEPTEAADIAKKFNVRVYTIGAGSIQQHSAFGIRLGTSDPIDEATLRDIADKTGGRYFRAQDAKGLARVYQEIDSLEKTKIESMKHTRYREYFASFAGPAAAIVWIELVAAWTLFRRSP